MGHEWTWVNMLLLMCSLINLSPLYMRDGCTNTPHPKILIAGSEGRPLFVWLSLLYRAQSHFNVKLNCQHCVKIARHIQHGCKWDRPIARSRSLSQSQSSNFDSKIEARSIKTVIRIFYYHWMPHCVQIFHPLTSLTFRTRPWCWISGKVHTRTIYGAKPKPKQDGVPSFHNSHGY